MSNPNINQWENTPVAKTAITNKDGDELYQAAPLNLLHGLTITLVASKVVISQACIVYAIAATSTKSSVQYIMAFDDTSLPINGSDSDIMIPKPISANGGFLYVFPKPKTCANGFVLGNSTTGGTLTTGSADCHFEYWYELV